MRTTFINPANKLKNFSVTITSEKGETKLLKEVIASIDIHYSNDNPRVFAFIIFKDNYDLNILHDWKTSEITIEYLDVFDKTVTKKFKVLVPQEHVNEKKEKIYQLKLQDKFSYLLDRSFYSKSFTDSPLNALQKFIEFLELDELAGEKDFSNVPENYSFIVPRSMPNLKFFEKEFNKLGYKFYQNKKGICVKGYNDLLPSKLPENDPEKPFIDVTDNQYYKNIIYDFVPEFNNIESTPPITRAFAYDITKKEIIYDDSMNKIDDFILNTDDRNLQDLNMKALNEVYQTHLNFNYYKMLMREHFMNQHIITIVTNGYEKNDLNQIYEIKLLGNKNTTESLSKGNVVVNGKYISYKITEKIIGENLLQKIVLKRADTGKD